MSKSILTNKQKEFIRNCDNHRWNIKEGAVRSGKTYLDLLFTIPYRILNANQKGLIFLIGNTQGTLETNILRPMREIYGKDVVGSINKSTSEIKLFGKVAYALGADKVSAVKRIHGATLSYCYGDEITTWNEEVFEEIKSRLSAPGAKFDGTCNPDSPRHWLLKFLENQDRSEENKIDIYRQKYLLSDNKENLDPDYYRNIQVEYAGTVYYKRFILGEWALAEGLIYSSYNTIEDPIDEVPEELNGFKKIACDYGTLNACVFGLFEQGRSGTWYLTNEYYYSGRSEIRQKTDSEYRQDLLNFIAGRYINKTLVDPSAASFITELKKFGLSVDGADNDVLDGIRRTSVMLNTGQLKILKRCKHTLEELDMYRWDPKKEEDTPIKENDHCMDMIRYFVNDTYEEPISTTPPGGAVLGADSYWRGY